MRRYRGLDRVRKRLLVALLLCSSAAWSLTPIPPARAQVALERRPSAEIGGQVVLEPRPATEIAASFEEGWRWVRFTTSSGLPSNSVYDVVETAAGTVWATTHRGLAWFDGYRWTAVGTEEGLPTRLPDAVAAFGADEVVVALDRRLYRGGPAGFREVAISIDGTSYEAVTTTSGAPGEVFVLAAPDRSGALEVLLYDGASFRWVAPRISVVADQDSIEIWSNGAGALWLPTATGPQRWENGAWQGQLPSTGLSDVAVSMIVETATAHGLASIVQPSRARGIWEWTEGEAPHRSLAEPADLFKSMDVADNGDAIVVYRSGDVISRHSGRWSPLERMPPQMTGALFVKFRRDGDLWVGTQRGLYLFRASSQRWTHREVPSPSRRNDILEILLARDGSLWLGTGQGVGIHRPDGTVEWVERVDGKELAEVTGLAEDRNGGIWISSGSAIEGAYRWDGRDWRHFGPAEGLHAPLVHKIRKDRSGRLWFLGMAPKPGIGHDNPEPGAFVLQDGAGNPSTSEPRFEPWTPDEGLVNGRVYDFVEGNDASKWFATAGGISRWRDGAWTHWTAEDGLRRSRIFTLAVDHEDRLWFGDQSNGLGYLDERGEPRYVTTAEGLIHDQVLELRVGPRGELWIATAGGLACLHEGEWLSFDANAGLSTPLLWPVLPLADRVIVGTLGRGIDVLSLAEAGDPRPRVALETPVVDQHSALLRWTADTYWGQVSAESVLTRFRLDRGDWSEWSTARETMRTGLTAGQHTFEVQARGFFGGSEESAETVAFATVSPLYRQPMFYLPVGALLLLVLALVEGRRRHVSTQRRRDREHRRRLEERFAERTDALRESEERLRQLLETVHVIPWVADATSCNFTYVGPQAVDVLGYPLEHWYEPTFWTDHMHPDDTDAAIAYCSVQSTLTDRYEFEYRMIAADGSVVWLHDLVAVVKEENLPTMLRGFMIDITARKHADAERFKAEAEALEHRERLAHISRVNMLGEMATGIAHEVNQPLTAVSTYTHACRRMIEAGLFDQDQIIDVLGRISDEAVRAGDMIHGLKALVRKRNSELRVCNLNQLVREVIPLAEVEARPLGIDIRLDLADDIADIVADEVQVQQVVLNLVRNAIESTEPSGEPVEIRTENGDDDMIEVAVIDHGSGLAGTDPEHLFQPFFSTKEEGMGMGLSISRSIIEAHGGQIGCRPGESTGSTFFFRLPAHDRRGATSGSYSQRR